LRSIANDLKEKLTKKDQIPHVCMQQLIAKTSKQNELIKFKKDYSIAKKKEGQTSSDPNKDLLFNTNKDLLTQI
jgi:hypothetical protein